jgi:uncharacterized membrane protein required for colicin V production
MAMIFPVLLLVLIIGIFASMMREGLWSSLLALFNVIFAALLATNFFEPVARLLTNYMPSGTMFWDFVAVWGLFAVAYLALRTATDQVSKFKVRFKKPIDMGGGYLLSLWTGYVFVCFTAMTLHMAPLARDFMWGGFHPENAIFFGLKPDRQWLGFVQMVSRGSLARWTDESEAEKYVFDPKGEFMPKYATRRAIYEKTDTFTGVR